MVRKITPEELEEKDLEEVEVIDIRKEHELNQTNGLMIPNSKHIPYSELTSRLDEIEFKDEVFVICRHGNSSIMAVRLLDSYEGSSGSDVYNVTGGYLEWEDEMVDPILSKVEV